MGLPEAIDDSCQFCLWLGKSCYKEKMSIYHNLRQYYHGNNNDNAYYLQIIYHTLYCRMYISNMTSVVPVLEILFYIV